MQKDEVTIFTFSFLSFLFLVLQKRFAFISFKLTFKSSNFWTSFILKWIFIASSLHESILSTFQRTLTDKPLFPLRSQSREFADSVTLIEIWLVKRGDTSPHLLSATMETFTAASLYWAVLCACVLICAAEGELCVSSHCEQRCAQLHISTLNTAPEYRWWTRTFFKL